MSKAGRLRVSRDSITFKLIEDGFYKPEKPLVNIKVELRCLRKNKSITEKTNQKGEVSFTLDEICKSKAELYRILLQDQNNYKRYPVHERNIVNYAVLNEIQKLRFERYTNVFRVNKITQNSRYCFQKGDKVSFIAYYPDSIQDKDIQWAYTFVSQNAAILHNTKLTQGDENELKTNPAKCKDNNKYYILKDSQGQAYKGKEVKDYKLYHIVNDSKMVVFAYAKEFSHSAYTELVFNDMIQITIDCSMQEALNATDEVSQLGWTTSYVLQRLWHDNPRYAKKKKELLYKNADDVMESMEEQNMKDLIKKYAPYLALEPFEIKQNLKANIDPCAFYVGLDWEEFYLKFDVMQRLSRRFFRIIAAIPDIYDAEIYNYEKAKQQAIEKGRVINLNSHITAKFLKSIQELVNFHNHQIREDFKALQASEATFVLAIDTEKIKNGIQANKEIYTIIPKTRTHSSLDSYRSYENLARIYPYNIDRAAMQTKLGLDDMDFGMEFISDMKNKQSIALYACTGKFSVYYVPATFLLKKENGKISIYIKELYAYVYDVFDFDDEGHSYEKGKEHKDENIKTLGQPVGTWDYNTLKFDFDNSIRQVAKYSEDEKISFWNMLFVKTANTLVKWQTALEIYEIPTLKQQQIYPLYNQDYQDYKQRFDKGLNFRVFSKDKTIKDKFHKGFYIVKVPSDEASQKYFKVEI